MPVILALVALYFCGGTIFAVLWVFFSDPRIAIGLGVAAVCLIVPVCLWAWVSEYIAELKRRPAREAWMRENTPKRDAA